MAKGGKREGAGRKKGYKAIEVEKAREYLVARVVADLEPIVSAQIDLAKGIRLVDEKGNVYQKAPDKDAAKYLLDHTVGKAKEKLDVQHSGLSLTDLYDASIKHP